MQGQRGQDFETAARGRHSFRFLGPRPNDRLSHPVKEAAYRAAIHLNPQRGVERLAHFLQAALGIALMRAPQERLRLGGEFATISLTPPVQETGEALGRQAGLVTKILWPTKGHRVSAEKLVHGQIGSSDLFYHRCDLLGSAFPAGRGPVHPPQHSLNMAIWPACSAVFVRSWGIKRYNWTMLFRGEDSSSSWLLIISSTDSFLRARESRFKDLEELLVSRMVRDQVKFNDRIEFAAATHATTLARIHIPIPCEACIHDAQASVAYPLFIRFSKPSGWVVHTSELTADGPVHDGSDSGLSLTTHLDVPLAPGTYQLAFATKNATTGDAGVLRTQIEVPAYESLGMKN